MKKNRNRKRARRQNQRAYRFDEHLKERLKDRAWGEAYLKERKAMFLAYRIQCLREDLGLTQADLARRMKTSQQAVSRLESGEHRGFTLKTLENLAQAMDVELVLDLKKKQRRRKAM
jgi:ribosome-binding protein aMBF1 (putative translation factor)